MPQVPCVLVIAGSDSSGGAGVQADLKTCAALQVYGATAITALTAQDTRGVREVFPVPASVVAAQIDAVVRDLPIAAVKTGMLATAETVEVVAAKMQEYGLPNLVVDPVLASHDGVPLLSEEGVEALRRLLLPLATVVTPNLKEAQRLVGRPLRRAAHVRAAAQEIGAMGPRVVVVKGGHRRGPQAVDVVYDGRRHLELAVPRLRGVAPHGTGCTLATAIAAWLARGEGPLEAVRRAKEYVTGALAQAYPVGGGRWPLHHFWQWWPPPQEDPKS